MFASACEVESSDSERDTCRRSRKVKTKKHFDLESAVKIASYSCVCLRVFIGESPAECRARGNLDISSVLLPPRTNGLVLIFLGQAQAS